MRRFISYYSIKMPIYIVYMFQQVEYDPVKFISWLIHSDRRKIPLSKIMYRKTLDYTHRAKLLLLVAYTSFISPILLALVNLVRGDGGLFSRLYLLLLIFVFIPLISSFSLIIFVTLAKWVIVNPKLKKQNEQALAIFEKHTGTIIAVAGSYGKTTMKELLTVILSQKFKVAATPGNMNTPTAHARFAHKLTGDEDIVIIEYGEGRPGDIERFARITQPKYAIITGLAPNHLDHYKTIDELAKDLFSLRKLVNRDKLLIADNSKLIKNYIRADDITFSDKSVLGWHISNIKVTINGINFSMAKSNNKFNLHSDLLGNHQVGPLALVVALGKKFGMSKSEIISAIGKTVAFEHRMQPYKIAGAWVIDDTYNGNLEGIRAGLKLLSQLDAKRKIYVTPGLVDQGVQTKSVHEEMADLIIRAKPDKVVLMHNSATVIIDRALKSKKFVGEVIIEPDPLDFYKNLEQFVAVGDLILMQNDWTDNYL